jgi:hypothetical protein
MRRKQISRKHEVSASIVAVLVGEKSAQEQAAELVEVRRKDERACLRVNELARR